MLKTVDANWDVGDMLTYGCFFSDILPHQFVSSTSYSCLFEAEGPLFSGMAYAMIPVFISDPGVTPELSTCWSSVPEEEHCFIGLANYEKNVWEWYPGTLQAGIALDSFEPYDHPGEPFVLSVVCITDPAPATLEWIRFGPNIAPVADLEVDVEYGYMPATFAFDMNDSVDPELEIDHYEWDWDNDGVFETPEPNLPTCSHEFADYGQHTVVGKVVDDQGASSTAAVDIWVSRFVTAELDPTGHSPDAYIDAASVIHVSYSAGPDLNILRHGQLDGGTWTTNDLDTVSDDTELETCIAPFQAAGWMLFAYGHDKLYSGAWTGSSFNIETLSEDWASGRPAYAVDNDDRPHVLASDIYGTFPLTEQHFTHWYLDIGGWQAVELDGTDQSGQYCDAAVRGSLLHGVWAAPSIGGTYPVQVGTWHKPAGDPGVWDWQTISTAQNYHRRAVSLALAAGSKPRVCFIGPQEVTPYSAVHVMSADTVDGAWSDVIVGSSAWDAVLVLGPDDLPHVVYTNKHHADLYKRVWYTYSDGTDWHTEFAWQNPGADMEDLVLIVDQSSTPHLFYTDKPGTGAASRLMHAAII